MKKANGFKPFVLNSTVDACKYMLKRNNPIANLVFPFFEHFTNINHSCPYVVSIYLIIIYVFCFYYHRSVEHFQGEQILKNFYPKNEIIKLFLPAGDYLLLLSWILSKRKTFVTNVYFTFEG